MLKMEKRYTFLSLKTAVDGFVNVSEQTTPGKGRRTPRKYENPNYGPAQTLCLSSTQEVHTVNNDPATREKGITNLMY